MTLTRDEEQTGTAQCALLKFLPRSASSSMFGVDASGCPPRNPVQSFRSSMLIITTFGCSAPLLGLSLQSTPGKKQTSAKAYRRIVCLRLEKMTFLTWC